MPRTKEEKILCIRNCKIGIKTDAQMLQKTNKNETVIAMATSLHYREHLSSTKLLLQHLQNQNLK